MEGIEERAEIGVNLGLQIAGQKTKPFPGLDGGACQDDSAGRPVGQPRHADSMTMVHRDRTVLAAQDLAHPMVARVLSLTAADELVPIRPTIDEALAR